MAALDPYRDWLGIEETARPLNFYQLLGLARGAVDPARVERAVQARVARLREHAQGEQGKIARRVAAEVAAARQCLLDPAKKGAYDKKLQLPPSTAPEADLPLLEDDDDCGLEPLGGEGLEPLEDESPASPTPASPAKPAPMMPPVRGAAKAPRAPSVIAGLPVIAARAIPTLEDDPAAVGPSIPPALPARSAKPKRAPVADDARKQQLLLVGASAAGFFVLCIGLFVGIRAFRQTAAVIPAPETPAAPAAAPANSNPLSLANPGDGNTLVPGTVPIGTAPSNLPTTLQPTQPTQPGTTQPSFVPNAGNQPPIYPTQPPSGTQPSGTQPTTQPPTNPVTQQPSFGPGTNPSGNPVPDPSTKTPRTIVRRGPDNSSPPIPQRQDNPPMDDDNLRPSPPIKPNPEPLVPRGLENGTPGKGRLENGTTKSSKKRPSFSVSRLPVPPQPPAPETGPFALFPRNVELPTLAAGAELGKPSSLGKIAIEAEDKLTLDLRDRVEGARSPVLFRMEQEEEGNRWLVHANTPPVKKTSADDKTPDPPSFQVARFEFTSTGFLEFTWLEGATSLPASTLRNSVLNIETFTKGRKEPTAQRQLALRVAQVSSSNRLDPSKDELTVPLRGEAFPERAAFKLQLLELKGFPDGTSVTPESFVVPYREPMRVVVRTATAEAPGVELRFKIEALSSGSVLKIGAVAVDVKGETMEFSQERVETMTRTIPREVKDGINDLAEMEAEYRSIENQIRNVGTSSNANEQGKIAFNLQTLRKRLGKVGDNIVSKRKRVTYLNWLNTILPSLVEASQELQNGAVFDYRIYYTVDDRDVEVLTTR